MTTNEQHLANLITRLVHVIDHLADKHNNLKLAVMIQGIAIIFLGLSVILNVLLR